MHPSTHLLWGAVDSNLVTWREELTQSRRISLSWSVHHWCYNDKEFLLECDWCCLLKKRLWIKSMYQKVWRTLSIYYKSISGQILMLGQFNEKKTPQKSCIEALKQMRLNWQDGFAFVQSPSKSSILFLSVQIFQLNNSPFLPLRTETATIPQILHWKL